MKCAPAEGNECSLTMDTNYERNKQSVFHLHLSVLESQAFRISMLHRCYRSAGSKRVRQKSPQSRSRPEAQPRYESAEYFSQRCQSDGKNAGGCRLTAYLSVDGREFGDSVVVA
jgi:hypothetical protein